MGNKKVIILAILGVTAVISLIYGIVTPSSPRRASTVAAAKSAVVIGPAVSQSAAISATKRRAVRSKHAAWKRSPFVPAGTPGESSSISLRGIMWSKTNPKAMIGDTIAGKGDKVGNSKVVDIKKDRVIINDGTKDIELRINR